MIKRTSFTAISNYDNCPKAYHLSYIGGHRVEAGPAAQRGSRLHLAVERYLKGEIPEEQLPLEFVSIKSHLKLFKSMGAVAEQEWYVDEQWAFSPTDDLLSVIKGVVDIHWFDEGMLNIVDLKSGKKYPDHVEQLQLYAAMGYAAYPDATYVRVANLYLEGIDEWTGYPLAIKDDLQARWMRKALEVIRAEEFPARPSVEACKWCPFPKLSLCDLKPK